MDLRNADFGRRLGDVADLPIFDSPAQAYLDGMVPEAPAQVFVADCPACSAQASITERSHTWIRGGRMNVLKDGVCSQCRWDFTYSWSAAVVE